MFNEFLSFVLISVDQGQTSRSYQFKNQIFNERMISFKGYQL